MTIIAHRGFQEYGENSVMGIIAALHKQGKVEFDLFFVGSKWVLAHDFKSIHSRTETLNALLKTIIQSPFRKGMMIFDIKWDIQFNKHHNFRKALDILSRQILPFFYSTFQCFFQVSHMELIPFLICSDLKGKKGAIIEDTINKLDLEIDYLMIDIRFLCIHDLRSLKSIFPKKMLIGYTCPSVSLLSLYKNFFPILSHLVVDLRLSDLNFLNIK
jgi:hypothetical protein